MHKLSKIPMEQYADLLITKHKYDILEKSLTERGFTLEEETTHTYNNAALVELLGSDYEVIKEGKR